MNIIGQLCILKNKSEKELLEGYTSKVEFTADFKRKVLDALHTEKCCKVTTQSEKFVDILSDVEDITKETLLERVFNILKTERILPRDMSPILEACGSEEDFLIGMLFLKGIQCNGIVDSRYLIQYRYLDRKQSVPKLAHVGYGVEESTEELSNNISTTSSEVKGVDLNEIFPKQESDVSKNKEVEFPILPNKETEEYNPKVSEDMFSDNIICDMFGIDKENETANEVVKDTAEEAAYESQEQEKQEEVKQQTELDKEAIEEESIVSKETESKAPIEEPVDEEKQEENDIMGETAEENDIVEETVEETVEEKHEEQEVQDEHEVQETVEEQDEHVQEVQETVEEQDEQEQDTDKTVEQEQEQESLTDKAIESVIDMSTKENVQEENDANEQTELVDELEEREVEEKPEDTGSPIQENTASILQSESTSIFSRFIN